jgi:hypothetical protein
MVSKEQQQEAEQLEEIKQIVADIGKEAAQAYVPPMPMDKLEQQSMLVNPSWGQENEYSPSVKLKFKKNDVQHLDEFSAIYKRDLRVGKLSKALGELHYCSEHIDFARDCLSEGFSNSALTAQSRAITTIEISHNDNGFFRTNLNTFRKEETKEIREPKDKTLFGKPTSGDEGLQ